MSLRARIAAVLNRSPLLRGLSLREGSTLHSIAALGGGTAAGQVLVVLTAPIITRLYTPSDIGLAGVFMAFVEFAVVGLGLRYELGIVSARSKAEGDWLLAATLMFTFPLSAVAALLMHGLIRLNLLSYGDLAPWSPFLAFVTLALGGGFQSIRYWLVRRGAYASVSRGLVAQGAGRAVVPVALGSAQLGWLGVIGGEIAGRFLGIATIVAANARALRDAFRLPRSRFRRAALARHRKLPAVVLPSTLLETIGGCIPAPLIAWIFGSGPAGEFVLVNRLSWVPVGFIAASVADVFHARAARAYESDAASVRGLLRALSLRLGLLGVLIFVPIMLISPVLFGPLLGREWARSGVLMSILAPVSIVALVVSPASRLLLVVNRSELKLIVDVVRLVVPVAVLLILRRLGCGFVPSMIALSATWTLSYLLYFLLLWKASAPTAARIPARTRP